MLQNGQTYFKNLAVWTSQEFMFGHFTILCMKELSILNYISGKFINIYYYFLSNFKAYKIIDSSE